MLKNKLAIALGLVALTGCQEVPQKKTSEAFLEDEAALTLFQNQTDNIFVFVKSVKLDEEASLGLTKTGSEITQAYMNDVDYLNIIQDWKISSWTKQNAVLTSEENSKLNMTSTTSLNYISGVESSGDTVLDINIDNVEYGSRLSFEYNTEKKTMMLSYNKSELVEIKKMPVNEEYSVELPSINSVGYSAELTLRRDGNFIQRYKDNEYLIVNFVIPEAKAEKAAAFLDSK